MRSKIQYLYYLIKHKWYVMLECFRFGLIWRGIVHDASKFLPSEFFPYANFFYGKNRHLYESSKKKSGYCKPTSTEDPEFDFAWISHCKRNRHHWQWWIIPDSDGKNKVLPIPEPYLTEMLCDWVGAGKALGNIPPSNDPYQNVRTWYEENKLKLNLAEETREEIEKRIKKKAYLPNSTKIMGSTH